jgi:hypothetical protein
MTVAVAGNFCLGNAPRKRLPLMFDIGEESAGDLTSALSSIPFQQRGIRSPSGASRWTILGK